VTYQCGIANVTPSYTATLSAGENADDYTFVWTYGNKKDTVGATYTPVLTESTTVTCTVTHNTENFSLSGSVEVTVVNQGTAPVIAICTDSLTVTDKGSENIVKVKWGESANEEFISATTLNHIYSTAGEYTIAIFGNIGIKDNALVFPRKKIGAYIMAPTTDAFTIWSAG
jgi:hypothetical protein